jgi:ribonucleoside-diphosphate reductase alpha chain
MYVVKRDGAHEPVAFDKITSRLSRLVHGPGEPLTGIDPAEITQAMASQLVSGMSTAEIDSTCADLCADRANLNPDYDKLASRVLVSRMHKENPLSFSEVTELLYTKGLVSESYVTVVRDHKAAFDGILDPAKDYLFGFFGLRTISKGYLLQDSEKGRRLLENPCHMLLRVAVHIHRNDTERVLESYTLFASHAATHATPCLFNAGSPTPQCASCFLMPVEDDSVEGIYESIKDAALISKMAGGIGLSCTNVRSAGSLIRGTNGLSDGVGPMLRVFQETALYINQGGRRKGSIAVFMEPWHLDIFTWVQMKRNDGVEDQRCRHLFYGLWTNDIFMRRVQDDLDWTLLCPSEFPRLVDLYGEEFDVAYEFAEHTASRKRVVKARSLWSEILKTQAETGTPYILFKDSCNAKSNQKNIGTIRGSNLCTEIVQFSGINPRTGKKEVAVCNLASISLPYFVSGGQVDYKGIARVAGILCRNLDTTIDSNYYPIEAARTSNLAHRPVGIGVQGFASMLFKLRFDFDSEAAAEVNRKVFEAIYYGAVRESCNLAREKGAYESFPGSPASQGVLQFDMWPDAQLSPDLFDWDQLKADIREWGLRNSLVTAPMPTATTAQILSNPESFEPVHSNMYTRRVISGEYSVFNTFLIRDLQRLGLWDSRMKDMIIEHEGSIQGIQGIPPDIKSLYRTAFEISPRTILDLAAGRSPFVDQSQSLNAFFTDVSSKRLSALHFYAWQRGLKTGMYYLRSKAAASPQKVSLNVCESCSA